MRKPNPSKATTITSLEQLEQIVRKPARCRIEFGEQKLEVEVVRLRPCEAAVVERILKTPVPPFVAAVGNQPEHYHTEDAAYREELRRAQFTARAVTVYFGCPIYRTAMEKEKILPGDQDFQQKAQAFVESRLTDDVLAILAAAITGEAGGNVPRLVDFFSPSDSRPS